MDKWCHRLYTPANLVTLLRPVCTPIFVCCCVQAQSQATAWSRWGAVLLWLAIIISDILDGRLARRYRQSSAFGRMLDHLCDILFILAALGYFAWQGLAPWWFPAAIAWAFGLYVFDSWWRTTGQQRRLIGSRLGHLGGMLNYLAVGLLTVNIAVGYPLLSATLLWTICLGLTCLALLSGAERLWGLVSGWRAHVKQAGLCVLLLVQTGANTLPV